VRKKQKIQNPNFFRVKSCFRYLLILWLNIKQVCSIHKKTKRKTLKKREFPHLWKYLLIPSKSPCKGKSFLPKMPQPDKQYLIIN
jgi:hypothetical protein